MSYFPCTSNDKKHVLCLHVLCGTTQ